MSDPSNLSKRERQKARRDAKLRQQRAAATRARRTRLAVTGLIVLLFAGAVGVFVYGRVQEGAQARQRAQEAAARLEELGCTPEQEQQIATSSPHLGGEQLAASPPQQLYPDPPPTSGLHVGAVVKTGVYDVQVDPRILVHNLEHGYVVAYYTEDAPRDQVRQLQASAQEHIDGDYPKLVVARHVGDLQSETNFVWTAWGVRQSCDTFDPDVLAVFLDAHHGGSGDAPEKSLPPHLEAGGGVLEPGGEDLLLPPLADQPDRQAPGDVMETEAGS